jgi:HEAT repeat protein
LLFFVEPEEPLSFFGERVRMAKASKACERLEPPGRSWPEQARRLIAQLDDDDPGVREEAARKLREKGFFSEPPLLKALEAKPSVEARIRIERLLAPLSKAFPIPKGEPLRRHRAIWALELIGTKEAREVLGTLAKDSPSLRERNDAKAALERLERKD